MRPIGSVAIIGAGNMGSGIAQKSAQEQFDVQMVDREEQWVERGQSIIASFLDEAIERRRDMKLKWATKLVGESVEKHCENEFNRIRATAFPHAYFEKDNDIVAGSKGDYIFRELDEDGTELISIMFEMKNESENTASKKRNEDFLKELNKDREAKQCEYAILVSLLEPDSDLFNSGI